MQSNPGSGTPSQPARTPETFQAAFEVRTNTWGDPGGKQVKQDCAVCHRLSVLINGKEYKDGEAATLRKGETHTVKAKDTPEPRDTPPGGDSSPPHTSNQKFTVWPKAVDGQTITSIAGTGPADSPQVFIAKKAEILQYLLDNSEGLMAQNKDWPEDPADEPMNKTARLLPVDIDFIHPATGEMDESRETSEGGYIAIRRDEQTPVTKLKLRKLDGIANAQFKLVFSSSKMKLWKDAGRTQAVESDSTTFPGNQDTDLFFEGVEKSSAAKDIEIGLKVKIGSTEETAAKARATVVQSEFPVILRAFIPYKWTQPDISPTTYTIAAEGDNRGLALTEQNVTFRVRQKINITPYADLSTATDIVNKRVADKALISRHYDKNMAVPIGERSGIHGYNLIDGIQPRDSGEPTLPVKTFEFKTRASSRNITYYLELSGEDGALPWYVPAFAAPNIDWKYDIKVDCTDPAKPKINVKGERDGFPAYEILVTTSDGTIKEIYYWRPTVNVQVGFGPLTTPTSIDETLEVP